MPTAKLQERYPRTLANLRETIRHLPQIGILDNDDLGAPFRLVAVFEDNQPVPE